VRDSILTYFNIGVCIKQAHNCSVEQLETVKLTSDVNAWVTLESSDFNDNVFIFDAGSDANILEVLDDGSP
jgi:hypothetical protein